jgi:hypothetical protein
MEREINPNTAEASSCDTDPWEEINTIGGNGDGPLFSPCRTGRIRGLSHPDRKHSAQAFPERVGGLCVFFASLPRRLFDQRVDPIARKSDELERSYELLYSLREEFGERLSARGSREWGRDFGDREQNERTVDATLN